jgi:hypothetical protein
MMERARQAPGRWSSIYARLTLASVATLKVQRHPLRQRDRRSGVSENMQAPGRDPGGFTMARELLGLAVLA